MTGIPGLRGTEHIGFTVPDLDQAERFFVDVIGCERIYSLGPFSSDDDWMAEHLGVHPRTVMRELRFFRCKSGPNFEVFQYEPADEAAPQPRNSDIGGHHLAFYVDDFDQLAKENSACPSKNNGGDLGWFEPTDMVLEFSTACAAIAKGELGPHPFVTKFGVHVIWRTG